MLADETLMVVVMVTVVVSISDLVRERSKGRCLRLFDDAISSRQQLLLPLA
jgi:hypothetical protein